MDLLNRAAQSLTPYMAEERRDTWLTLAFHAEHRQVYDSIPQRGATADFVVVCVRSLLDRGCLGSRHALSVLLETVRGAAGDERQAEFQLLIDELDRSCRPAAGRTQLRHGLTADPGPPRPTTIPKKKEASMLISRLPDREARRDLQKIAGCDDPQRRMDVVFVHGLGGDSWTTWMADPDNIGSFWPHWLAEDVGGLGIWTLGYAASGSKWKEESMPLADRGNQVLDLLYNDDLGQRPLIFITHSMGGIVVKQILRNADAGVKRFASILTQTRGIAFIATPHSGANLANFAELVAAIYRTNEHVGELAAHHPRLLELHQWFLNNYLENHSLVCRTYCERRELRPEIPLLGIRLPKGVLVVDATSAEPNIRGEGAIPLDEDHLSICKPANRQAQLYRGMLRFVKDCLLPR
ncbi:MAG: hypothetical protein V5B33_01010 [Candidatus Accumulibacter sp. UW20]|jgi:pimeloyl-ACP methyl ester carboxylesterase